MATPNKFNDQFNQYKSKLKQIAKIGLGEFNIRKDSPGIVPCIGHVWECRGFWFIKRKDKENIPSTVDLSSIIQSGVWSETDIL